MDSTEIWWRISPCQVNVGTKTPSAETFGAASTAGSCPARIALWDVFRLPQTFNPQCVKDVEEGKRTFKS